MVLYNIYYVILNSFMKKILFWLIAAFSVALWQDGYAQLTHILTTESPEQVSNHPTGVGRDFWFCIPQNFDRNQPGAAYYLYIYISSLTNTAVHIQVGNNPVIDRSVAANNTEIIACESGGITDFPLSTMMFSSDSIEQNAIHVWSDDADVSVYFISRAPFTSDGMYCIPTMGWGTEYVVASFNAFDRYGLNIIDLPSEFSIVADRDSTVVSITPSWGIRKTGSPLTAVHPKDSVFMVLLNRGECIQYQSAGDPVFGEDLTGSYITSNKPIGVIGASVCPNIKDDDNTCDHIIEMLSPTRTWADTYFTAPFTGRQYGGDAYLVVGTKKDQIIVRNGSPAATINKAFGYQYIFDDGVISPHALWSSDTTFMLVQYVPSASFGAPGTSRNIGDPDMVVVNPVRGYGKNTIFQIPVTRPGQTPFQNFLNIILPVSNEATTFIDGKPLSSPGTSFTFGYSGAGGGSGRTPIGTTGWEAILLGSKNTSAEGTHIISSDTTVGVYLYGRGSDDGYAFAGGLGSFDSYIKDTSSPVIGFNGSGAEGTIIVQDNHNSKNPIVAVERDSLYNMAVTTDLTMLPKWSVSSDSIHVSTLDIQDNGYLRLTYIYNNGIRKQSIITSASQSKVESGKNHNAPYFTTPDPLVSSSTVTISYDFGAGKMVALSLFDLAGHKLGELPPITQEEAGGHSGALSLPAGLSNGTYVLQAVSGTTVFSSKIIISK